MKKHIHIFESSALMLAVFIVGVFAYSSVQQTEQSANESLQTSTAVEPDFTTVVSRKVVGSQGSEAPVDKATEPRLQIQPSNPSDILDNIEFEEKEYTALLTPNDPQYPLWFWEDINAAEGWDITTGSDQVVIAVIDSGYALNHQELIDGWYTNAGEQGTTAAGEPCWDGTPRNKQSNACDDDQNGYTDDWRGWDFYSIDNSPLAGETNPNGDGVRHGTLVSGLIGASANNNIGFTGLDWQAKIMPLQALSDGGGGVTSDIVAAVEYAVDNGADVINLSLGGAGNDPAMQAAVSYAWSQNVAVIAASGNCATLAYTFCSSLPSPGRMGYPALYEEVIAVGAVDSAGNRASFSSYGPELDVVAPGQGISITTSWEPGNQLSAYSNGISGTSFASPITAGLAGLMKAVSPSITNAQVRSLLQQSAVAPGGTFSNEYGHGIIQVDQTLVALTSGSIPTERARVAPAIASTGGQNPAAPLQTTDNVVSTLQAASGDTLTITAVNINSNVRVSFDPQKSDDSGLATFSYQASVLGSGAWRLIPSTQELSGIAETIYIN